MSNAFNTGWWAHNTIVASLSAISLIAYLGYISFAPLDSLSTLIYSGQHPGKPPYVNCIKLAS